MFVNASTKSIVYNIAKEMRENNGKQKRRFTGGATLNFFKLNIGFMNF